jgi:hypothetical protein
VPPVDPSWHHFPDSNDFLAWSHESIDSTAARLRFDDSDRLSVAPSLKSVDEDVPTHSLFLDSDNESESPRKPPDESQFTFGVESLASQTNSVSTAPIETSGSIIDPPTEIDEKNK